MQDGASARAPDAFRFARKKAISLCLASVLSLINSMQLENDR